MIKINQLINISSKEYAKEELGEEQFSNNPDAVESITDNFKAGAEFVLENILALPNQYPLKGIISIQGDPNDPEAEKLSVKMSGLNEPQLIDLLLRFIQSRLSAYGTGYQVLMIPNDEAVRMKAFKESLALVKDRGKLKLD